VSERAALIVDRMEARLAAICEAYPPIRPGAQHWLDSDCGPSYCRKCVIAARGKEFELGPPLVDEPSYHRGEWRDAFYDGIDGGYDTTSDSTAACDTCGETLSYILTEEGVDQEVDYYREAPLVALRDQDSYALDRLALNVWAGSSRHQILGVALAVNQGFRLLSGGRP
jgi:hypothetical protein